MRVFPQREGKHNRVTSSNLTHNGYELNGAHWHLLVNHFPIIGGLIATMVLGFGLFRSNESIIQLGFGLFVLMSLLTFITNQTGEQAEHYLESINLLNKKLLHDHEESR